MKYSLFDLMDRKSILQLKIERIPFEDKREILRKEYQAVKEGLGEYISEGVCTTQDSEEWHYQLYEINGKIWDLETLIGEGRNNQISLEEVGRAALKIREYNSQRIKIKNKVVEKTGIGHKEVKMYHASQELNGSQNGI